MVLVTNNKTLLLTEAWPRIQPGLQEWIQLYRY